MVQGSPFTATSPAWTISLAWPPVSAAPQNFRKLSSLIKGVEMVTRSLRFSNPPPPYSVFSFMGSTKNRKLSPSSGTTFMGERGPLISSRTMSASLFFRASIR